MSREIARRTWTSQPKLMGIVKSRTPATRTIRGIKNGIVAINHKCLNSKLAVSHLRALHFPCRKNVVLRALCAPARATHATAASATTTMRLDLRLRRRLSRGENPRGTGRALTEARARASNPRDRRFRYDDYVRIFGYGVVYLAAKIRGGPAGHDRSFVAVRQAGRRRRARPSLKLRATATGGGQAAAPICVRDHIQGLHAC